MPMIIDTVPVRTRLPLAAWVVATVVTFASLLSSLLQGPQPFDHALPGAEQGIQPIITMHQAKV
jgi:hypothetical protein